MNSALSEALKLLAKRERFEAELCEKLEACGFDGDAVASAISQLIAWGVLSDARAELNLAEAHLDREGHGRLKLVRLFASHGLTESEAEDLAKRHVPDELEAERARLYLLSLPLKYQRAEPAYRKLVGRGFDPEIVQTIIESTFSN